MVNFMAIIRPPLELMRKTKEEVRTASLRAEIRISGHRNE